MKKQPSGFVIISSVLIMSAGIWLILIGLASLQMNDGLTRQTWQASNDLAEVANGCQEIAARAIVLNRSWAGQNLSWGVNSCIIGVVRNGKKYQISIEAQSGQYNKKFQIKANINANHFDVETWQELE